MKDIILDCLKRPFCHYPEDINKITKIKTNDIRIMLDLLVNEGLVHNIDNCYYLKKQGTIEIKDKGFGFIKVEGEEEDYFVSEFDVNGASNGDVVSFYVLPKAKNDKLDSGVVINIIVRKNTHVYGKVVSKKNKKGITYYVVSHNKEFDVKCYIDEQDLNGAVPGSIVSAKITKYLKQNSTEGIIEKVLGYEDDPGVDISLIAEKYQFFKDFPESVSEQIKEIPNSIEGNDYPNRKDFRDKTIITIDGDDSKDFDDAITVELLDDGNYYLGVYIADVSEYVKTNTPLDDEALYRATSVYLADRVIPMLPHKLSNGICSLNEDVDRLVLACEMIFDPKGKLVNYEISEGVIRSKHRMTYNNVNKMLDGDIDTIKKYDDIYSMINLAYELSLILRNIRTKKGAIEFEVPEYKVNLDEKGEPISFVLRTRDRAEMLIEDFMLAANETVAYHMSISNLPCVYRIHEDPKLESVVKVYNLINQMGLHAVMPKNKIRPMDIQKVMDMAKKSDNYFQINQMMLRSMAKAKYSEKNSGHYGLAMEYYCHFTSPIRRYPDLMVHRLIKNLIIHNEDFDEKMTYFDSVIHEIANHSSIKEREAIDCEREVVDMLMAKYMENRIGETYIGVIDSITKFGMFIMLDNGVEGLVHISNLSGYYSFDELSMQLIGKDDVFKIGDKVEIVVYDVSKKERKIDFVLKKDYDNMWGAKDGNYDM